jgi:uncharacterized protein (UPF0332 family)
MSYDWKEYFDLAKSLCDDPTTPGPPVAALRTTMSRAYYACYHKACELSQTDHIKYRPILTSGSSDHRKLINYLCSAPEKSRQRIGQHLGRLRDLRNKADYDNKVKDLKKNARTSIREARKALEMLDNLSR